jgi:hypothetical protein
MATTTGPRPTRVLGANLDKERARMAQQGRLKAIAKLAGVLTTNDDLRGEFAREVLASLETISKLAGGSPIEQYERAKQMLTGTDLYTEDDVEAILDICDDAAWDLRALMVSR